MRRLSLAFARGEERRRDAWLSEFTRKAMACQCRFFCEAMCLRLAAKRGGRFARISRDAGKISGRSTASISLMSRVNRVAATEKIIVDELLFELLELGRCGCMPKRKELST